MPYLAQEDKNKLARELYENYANHYRFRNQDGSLMKIWHDLSNDDQRLWLSLVNTVVKAVERA